MTKNRTTGLCFALFLTIILAVMKFTKVINWDWIWVFVPIYLLVLLWLCIVVLVVLVSDEELDESDRDDELENN